MECQIGVGDESRSITTKSLARVYCIVQLYNLSNDQNCGRYKQDTSTYMV